MTTTTGRSESVARTEPFFSSKVAIQVLSGDEGLLSSGEFDHSSLEQDFLKIRSWLGKTHRGSLEVRGISTEDHEKLKQRLISQGLRLRYDWDPENRSLALFMPHYIHEAPGEWLCLQTGWLQRELRLVSSCGRPTLSSGGAGASTLVNGKHTEPDKSILVHYEFDGFEGSSEGARNVYIPYPRIVLETAYSQSLSEAKAKLRNHLLLSEGHTHVGILCNMKHPVTLNKNFWATIELWTRDVDEDDTEAQVPHEIFDFPHKARPVQDSKTGGNSPEEGEESVGSSPSASTVIGTDPDATLGDETEIETWPATGEKIRRRWGPVTLIKEDANSMGATTGELSLGDFLPLNVYDFLRVCPMHDEPELWMPPNELLLPLDDLRVTIMNAVVRERERIRRSAAQSSTSSLSQSPRPPVPLDLPEGTRKRGNPLKEKKGSKRPKV